jgi:hypothetical protein
MRATTPNDTTNYYLQHNYIRGEAFALSYVGMESRAPLS